MMATNVARNASDDTLLPSWKYHYITPSGMPELGQKDLPLQPYYQSAPLVKAYLRFSKLFDGSESSTNLMLNEDITTSEGGQAGIAQVFTPLDL